MSTSSPITTIDNLLESICRQGHVRVQATDFHSYHNKLIYSLITVIRYRNSFLHSPISPKLVAWWLF